MISRLVLSLKEAADGAENETEASFTTMSFSTSFAAREPDPDLNTSAYNQELPIRARRRTANLNPDVE